jgi:peroxiredoxin Q/BCP
MSSWPSRAVAILMVFAALSCGQSNDAPPRPYGYGYGPGLPKFRDDAKTNTKVAPGALDAAFVDAKGKSIDLKQYRGKKNVVLVVTRGYPGYICPNCSAQTSRLISNYPEFVKRDAEVLVVFPGPTEHLQEFRDRTESEAGKKAVPFPIVLDKDFHAVDRLGIRGDLAKPATFIVDKHGDVKFAYVGVNTSDRPSLKAMLDLLDAIQKTNNEKASSARS